MTKKIPYYIISILFIGATFYYGYFYTNSYLRIEFILDICRTLHLFPYVLLFTGESIFIVFLYYTPFVYIGAIITEYIIKLIIELQEKRDE
jgi:hypothetical protein